MNGDWSESRRGGAARTVLIVDDADFTAALLEMACSEIPGVAVKIVSSASDAIRLLDEGSEPVGLVITDIRMPVMDGFELIRFIRAHRTHAATPIIVVTADTDPETPERTARLGANAFFFKPFSPRAIRRALEQFLYAEPDST